MTTKRTIRVSLFFATMVATCAEQPPQKKAKKLPNPALAYALGLVSPVKAYTARHYLVGYCTPEFPPLTLRYFYKTPGKISSLSLAPGGHLLASAHCHEKKSSVRFHHTAHGKPLGHTSPLDGSVHDMVWSPNSQYCLTTYGAEKRLDQFPAQKMLTSSAKSMFLNHTYHYLAFCHAWISLFKKGDQIPCTLLLQHAPDSAQYPNANVLEYPGEKAQKIVPTQAYFLHQGKKIGLFLPSIKGFATFVYDADAFINDINALTAYKSNFFDNVTAIAMPEQNPILGLNSGLVQLLDKTGVRSIALYRPFENESVDQLAASAATIAAYNAHTQQISLLSRKTKASAIFSTFGHPVTSMKLTHEGNILAFATDTDVNIVMTSTGHTIQRILKHPTDIVYDGQGSLFIAHGSTISKYIQAINRPKKDHGSR